MKALVMIACMLVAPSCMASRIHHATERLDRTAYTIWAVQLAEGECPYAYVRDPDGFIHRIAVGDYIGRSDGVVSGIDPNGIEVTEIIPDGQGGLKESVIRIDLPLDRRPVKLEPES